MSNFQQVIPKIAVERSSTELPGIGQTAPTAQAQAPSPLARWLKHHGIPFTTGRGKKGTSSLYSITASNVTAQELEQYYNWSFQQSIADASFDNNISCRNLLQKIARLFEPDEDEDSGPQQASHAFSLPSEWLTPEGVDSTSASSQDDEAFWRRTLLTFLEIHDRNHDYVKFRPQKDIETVKFPEPNIFHMKNERLVGGGIAWILTNILASPVFKLQQTHQGPKSELEVERLHGSPLSGFFNVPGCETTSNVPLSFREELLCFGSQPKPDFAARIKHGIIPVKRLSYDLYPVSTLGESKRKRISQESKKNKSKKQDSTRLQIPSESDTQGLSIPPLDKLPSRGAKLPMVAQLAFSAYSSLVMVITFLITEWKSSPPTPKGRKPKADDYQIPEHAIIYGIGYASNGLLIYAFFPYIRKLNKNNFPSEWGFRSVLVCSEFSDVFRKHNIQLRFKLVKVLLMLQQHATRLTDKIQAVKNWPEEFLD